MLWSVSRGARYLSCAASSRYSVDRSLCYAAGLQVHGYNLGTAAGSCCKVSGCTSAGLDIGPLPSLLHLLSASLPTCRRCTTALICARTSRRNLHGFSSFCMEVLDMVLGLGAIPEHCQPPLTCAIGQFIVCPRLLYHESPATQKPLRTRALP